jgi:hypothetical protein
MRLEDLISFIGGIVQWLGFPLAMGVYNLYNNQRNLGTDIAVIKKELALTTQAHDRELAEIRETTNKIFSKLNSIEEALRK